MSRLNLIADSSASTVPGNNASAAKARSNIEARNVGQRAVMQIAAGRLGPGW